MNIDTFDVRKLRAFHLVARHGNLRAAAVRLHQTVPGISARLRRLESDLGFELFERLHNKLILTAAGERLLREVDEVFRHIEKTLAALSSATPLQGKISASIGSDHSWYFAPKIGNFLKRYPGIDLSLHVYQAADALRALARGELDISIGIFPKLPKGLEKQPVAQSTLSLVCTPDHALVQRRSLRLADLTHHRLIVLPRHAETRKLVDKAMSAGNIEAKSIIEVANCQTAYSLVTIGVGVAIVHSLCMTHMKSDVIRCVDLGHGFGKVDFSLVYRKGAMRSPLLHALLDELTA